MRTSHISWVTQPCRAVFCGIPHSPFLNKLKYSLNSKAVTPIFLLLNFSGMLCLLQPYCPWPSHCLAPHPFLWVPDTRLNASASHLLKPHQEIAINILTWLFMKKNWFHGVSSSKLQAKEVWISFPNYCVIIQTEPFKALPLLGLIGTTIFPCWLWEEKSISANVHSYWFIFPFGFLI